LKVTGVCHLDPVHLLGAHAFCDQSPGGIAPGVERWKNRDGSHGWTLDSKASTAFARLLSIATAAAAVTAPVTTAAAIAARSAVTTEGVTTARTA
jgi:hypothetical protein